MWKSRVDKVAIQKDYEMFYIVINRREEVKQKLKSQKLSFFYQWIFNASEFKIKHIKYRPKIIYLVGVMVNKPGYKIIHENLEIFLSKKVDAISHITIKQYESFIEVIGKV